MMAGDSARAEVLKVVTRMHKTLIWERTTGTVYKRDNRLVTPPPQGSRSTPGLMGRLCSASSSETPPANARLISLVRAGFCPVKSDRSWSGGQRLGRQLSPVTDRWSAGAESGTSGRG
ncbi:hypothetical protein DMB66_45625 [Actinoplanes sp. ATCC 53533]|nr:hypothetical protein DMB66_45625 [Actinoplanes sp. ATCC 53533]